MKAPSGHEGMMPILRWCKCAQSPDCDVHAAFDDQLLLRTVLLLTLQDVKGATNTLWCGASVAVQSTHMSLSCLVLNS